MPYEAPMAFDLSGGIDKRIYIPSPESCTVGTVPDKTICSVGSTDTGQGLCKCISGQHFFI